jgi:hypothetical protein
LLPIEQRPALPERERGEPDKYRLPRRLTFFVAAGLTALRLFLPTVTPHRGLLLLQ